MPSSCSCSGDSGSVNTPEDSVVPCELSSGCCSVDTGSVKIGGGDFEVPGKGHSDCCSCNSGTVETRGGDCDVTKSGDDVVIPGEGDSNKGVFMLCISVKHSKRREASITIFKYRYLLKHLNQVANKFLKLFNNHP